MAETEEAAEFLGHRKNNWAQVEFVRLCTSLLELPYKVAQTEWLKQQKFIFSVLETTSLKTRWQQSWFLLRTVRENLVHALPLISSKLFLAIFDISWLVDHVLIFMWHCPCVHICVQISPSYNDISHIGLGVHPTTVWASLVAQIVKNLPAMQETQVWSLSWEDLLEKEMATHYSIVAWRITWTEKPGNVQSIGLQRVGYDWVTNTTTVWLHLN